jgi:hypothetical protein
VVPNANYTSIITQCYTGVGTTQTILPISTYVYATGATYISTVAPTFVSAAGPGYCTANLTSGANSIPDPGAVGIIAETATGSPATVAARTLTGTANQIDLTNGNGASGNPTVSLDTAITMPGTVTYNAANCTGACLINQPYTPIYNTVETTDKLTSNNAVQYFSMNSSAAQIPANQLVTGKRISIYFVVDTVMGGTSSNTTLKIVLCSVSGCGSGVTPVVTGNSAAYNTTNTTVNYLLQVSCVGTAAAGSTATIICSAPGNKIGAGNGAGTALIANVPTNGILYINLSYLQPTQTGNFISLIASWAQWDVM